MAVAEIFLGAFLTVLFEKLASVDLISLARSEGIYSQLNKWNTTLLQIQALLADAGQKHMTQTAVQLWLNNLQDLAYDIDDALDDLATEAMRRKLNQESRPGTGTGTSTSKVLKIIPTCCTSFTPRKIMYGRQMRSKLDEITSKLHDLVEQKNNLGLDVNVNVNVERSDRRGRRWEQTSLVDESKIMGREGDKEALLGKLLGNESSNQNVSIVSIVGMGGVGKTTLAKVLYNEERVRDRFELRAWVCVSEEFDVFSISKAIFQAVAGEDKQFANLDLLHVALKEKLSNKRFLLVLDDVWNEEYRGWELLQSPFVVGSPGSKIIVTTRKTTVASVMDSVEAYDLDVLSADEALFLFAQHSLGEKNFDKHPELKLHAEDIVKKCGRLPLALITLGRVLKTKRNEDEWEQLLNSEIWNLHDEKEILPALRLSYYDLPPHLKQLFAYCSLFPKDYEFDKNKLVLLWMAEGFLPQSNGRKSMESLGREYFEELKSRSFFQRSANDESGYTMHDLINDLATSVAGEFYFRLDDRVDVNDRNEAVQKFRHFSFISQQYRVYIKFKELERARCLRTFLPLAFWTGRWRRMSLSTRELVDLLARLEFVRVLSLAQFSITEVPQSIGSLKHMRYLNLSHTDITCLPEQVSDLYNLQTLLVSHCHELSSLPVSFVKLRNLRHLETSDTPRLNKMPLGIGMLTSLQTLTKAIIEGADGFNISELKDLLDLQGQLSIEELQNVTNAGQAKEANLQQKKGLDDLTMVWSDVFDDSRNETNEYEVLQELKPHDKLRCLKIWFYGGKEFPRWVRNPSFDQLTELSLCGCRSCIYLPTLGHLRSLQKLFVSSMDKVKTVGFEFLAPTNSFHDTAFPSLQVLDFYDMQGWEIWSTSGGTAKSFPSLREIHIQDCPKLVDVSIGSIPSLWILEVEGRSRQRVLRNTLHIQGRPEAVLRSMVGVFSSFLTLTMWDIKGLTRLHREVLKHLGAVEELCIEACDELKYLWESESEAREFLVCLRMLKVSSCKKLVSLGEKQVNLGLNMESIKEVVFNNCEAFESYSCPNSVERLEICSCHSMTSLTFSTVWDIPSSLKILHITYCNNLVSLPGGCLVHLTDLTISHCDKIESLLENDFGFRSMICLRYLSISYCKNLKSFPYEHLQSLTSLEELSITHCPSMDYSFPCGLWPPNITTLSIGCLNKPMSQWGQQNYPTSLVRLSLHGENSGVISFAEANDSNNTTSSFLLPLSLSYLKIHHFMDLESLSEVLQHLTCLEELEIYSCLKLKDLPETTSHPSSLRVTVQW